MENNIMIIYELLLEIYSPVQQTLQMVLFTAAVFSLVAYLTRLSIRYVNDGKYDIYYFPEDNKFFKLVSFNLAGISYDIPGAILAPILCSVGWYILILIWPIVAVVATIVATLKGIRSCVRFKKKVNKHMEHLKVD
jgi:hypothetical protein